MNEIIIQVHADRKLSKKVVDIGNMQESGVTKLIFELDEDIVALGGNVYLITSYDGESHPHVLKDNSLEVDRSFTQRKKTETNIVVSTSNDTENPLDGVVWISNTLILTVDRNNINIDSINEEELPPSLKIIYDDLLNLQKDLQEKKDNDYWRGQQGPKGDAGSVKFVVVKELPTENIEENVMYLVQVESEEENNKFLEYIYVDGSWENVGSASVEVDLTDYVKNTDYATDSKCGIVRFSNNRGLKMMTGGLLALKEPTDDWIKKRNNGGDVQQTTAVTLSKFDYALKQALTDEQLVLTDEEKASALALLGGVAKQTVDRTSVYAVDKKGNQVVIGTSPNASNNGMIPIYNTNGTINSNTPSTDNQTANKKYVDQLVSQHDIINSASGEVVTTTDSAKVKPKNIKLFGKSKQKIVPGNQLFDFSKVVDATENDNTLTNNGDGSLTLNLSTSVSIGKSKLSEVAPNLVVGETYTLNATTTGTAKYVYLSGANVSWAFGKPLTITEAMLSSVVRFYTTGLAEGTCTISDIMINPGSTALPFEPYVGGEQSPNMKYPQKAEFLGASGSIGGKVLTSNFFDISKFVEQHDVKVQDNGFVFTNTVGEGVPTAIISSTTLGMLCPSLKDGDTVYLQFDSENIKFNEFYLLGSSRDWLNGQAITITQADLNRSFYLYVNYNQISACKNIIISKAPLPYEPYTEQPFTVLTPNGLRGIPLGTTIPDAIKNSPIHMSGVYWDKAEGQYHIGDTKNENGKEDVQRIGEYVADANNDIQAYEYGKGFLIANLLSNVSNFRGALCNQLRVAHDYTEASSGTNMLRLGVNNTNLYLFNNSYYDETLEDKGLANFKAHLNENPLKIWTWLDEPIITDTTDQYDVVMNYPNTTIVNDEGAYMEVEYVADTQKHIEQNYVAKSELEDIKSQMAEIQQVITNL